MLIEGINTTEGTNGAGFYFDKQALSASPRDRSLSVAFAQATATMQVEERGTYRADLLNLVSFRTDKNFRLGARRRIALVAGPQRLEQPWRPEQLRGADEKLREPGRVRRGAEDDLVLQPLQEIVAPRILKVGLRLDF